MVRLLLGAFAFIAILVGLLAPSAASDHDGDPKLCGTPWWSAGSSSSLTEVKRRRVIISECAVINTKTLDAPKNPAFIAFLAEVKELWKVKRLPKGVLYRYTLTIKNDWKKNISMNLSRWQVVHSPYTLVAKGFSINIPSCSYVRIQFLSPWPPKLYGSPVNIGTTEKGIWHTIGDGRATIATPVWFQYYSEGISRGKLPANEAKTKTCSSI